MNYSLYKTEFPICLIKEDKKVLKNNGRYKCFEGINKTKQYQLFEENVE